MTAHRRNVHPSEPRDYKGDVHSRATMGYQQQAGKHIAPVAPRDVDWLELSKDICSRDLPESR